MTPDQLQEGVLCQLKMGRWDASVRMPKEKLGRSVPKEIVRAMQDLVDDRTPLKELSTIRRTSKGWLQRNSLPFPVDGVFWLPKEKIPEADAFFSDMQSKYFAGRTKLKKNVKKMERDFKKKYPDFYNPKNYPSPQRLESKFYYYWNFFHFTVPDKESEILSPKLYKKEQEKFRKMVSQMEEMTINLVGNMLFKRINKLAEQCDSGKINAGTFNSIERFIGRWDDLWRDHVDNKKMRLIMARLRKEMRSATSERLKNNDDFRSKMGEQLESIVERLKVVPNFQLKRRLDV